MIDDITLLHRLSRETKAMLIINEFRFRTLAMIELAHLLDLLSSSMEQREQTLDMIRRQAIAMCLPPEEVQLLVSGLTASPAESEKTIQTNVQAPVPGHTVRVHRFDAPEPHIPHQTSFQVRRPDAPAPAQPSAPTPAPQSAPPPQPSTPAPSFQVKAPQPAKPASGLHPTHLPGMTARIEKQDVPFYGGGSFADTAANRFTSKKILLADDDARIRMVFHKKLVEAGYIIEEADNGEHAWKLLQEESFRLAIMDMKMPGLHGLEILQRLSSQGPHIPVIICSAYEQLQDEFVVRTYPWYKYLVKPVGVDKLLAAVSELIAVSESAK